MKDHAIWIVDETNTSSVTRFGVTFQTTLAIHIVVQWEAAGVTMDAKGPKVGEVGSERFCQHSADDEERKIMREAARELAYREFAAWSEGV